MLREIEDSLVGVEHAAAVARRKVTIVKLRRTLSYDIFGAVVKGDEELVGKLQTRLAAF